METTFREALPGDLPECLDVFAESLTDLSRRHNLPPPGPVNPYRIAIHEHILFTGIFHVAQQGQRLVAFACAIVRGRTWFLAGFWARPAVQKQHIGMTLLRRVSEAGRKAGASTWFVWASSDLPALSAYMKIGMLPGCQLMAFEGRPQVDPGVPPDYIMQPLNSSVAAKLDRLTRGARREQDHNFWIQQGWQGTQVLRGGVVAGYFYLHEGNLGPAAWTHPRHANAVLGLACRGQANISMEVPGMNHEALKFAFGAGLRLAQHSHLLTTAPFGRLERYLPSGPYLF